MLSDIYQRCNVAICEPARCEETQKDPKWKIAMEEEMSMIQKNKTWELVDKLEDRKVIRLNTNCSKKQEIVAQSTIEAKLIPVTAIVNQATIVIANNPVYHGKTKHFNIKLYFLREMQQTAHIKGSVPPKNDPKFEAWDDEDSLITIWLWNSITLEISSNYMFYSSVHEIWENLIETYSMKKNSTACYDIESTTFNSR
ncbi:hypothetical protein CR513_19134, partial [Mucuna pruriens]